MAERKTSDWSKRSLLILMVSMAVLVLLGLAGDALRFWQPGVPKMPPNRMRLNWGSKRNRTSRKMSRRN